MLSLLCSLDSGTSTAVETPVPCTPMCLITSELLHQDSASLSDVVNSFGFTWLGGFFWLLFSLFCFSGVFGVGMLRKECLM